MTPRYFNYGVTYRQVSDKSFPITPRSCRPSARRCAMRVAAIHPRVASEEFPEESQTRELG